MNASDTDAASQPKAAASAGRRRIRMPRWLGRLLAVVAWPFAGPRALFRRALDPARTTLARATYAGLALGTGGAVALLLYLLLLIPLTPGFKSLQAYKVQRPTVVLAATGEELYRFQDRNREWATLEDIAPGVVEALVATEDHRFYDHHGVDGRRLVASVLYSAMGDTQGGSTLTMQLARNLYPRRVGRSWGPVRKLKEIVTAFKIEACYEKDEILVAYLNTVPFLYNVYGIELAAQTYFSKPAAALTVPEAATLVGMLKATSYYNPVRHPERARWRRNVVLGQMEKHGRLTAEAAADLRAQPLRTRFERQHAPGTRAPHFVAHVRRWLEAWADDEGINLYADGLVVHTTLNMRLQALAEAAVKRQGEALQHVANVEWGRSSGRLLSTDADAYKAQRRQVQAFGHFWREKTALVDQFIRATPRFQQALAAGQTATETLDQLRDNSTFMDSLRAVKTRLEVGFVAMDPRNGKVRAWVGSRGYRRGAFDHVAQARRQPGSTFKPFVYAAALEAGYLPDDRLPDSEVAVEVGDGQIWRPVNAGGIMTGEEMTLRAALAHSKNTIPVQLIQEVGPRRTARLARRMGVSESELTPVPSLALGTSAVTLLEMTNAYATIADGGRRRTPVVVSQIEEADGTVLATFDPEPEQALSEESAHALVDMMRGVIDEGTGRRIRNVFGVRADVAGKTGTTQDNADGWFLMMHPHLVAGAWVGFNDPRVTFRTDYWGQGSHNALYVVGDFYRHALRQGQLDPRPKLAPVPVYESEKPAWKRAGGWLADRFNGLKERFKKDDTPQERQLAEDPEPEPQPERRARSWNSRRDRDAERQASRNSNRNHNSNTDRDGRGVAQFARELEQVFRVVGEALEDQGDVPDDSYREGAETFLRDAEQVLQHFERFDTQRRQGERIEVADLLEKVTDDLSPRQQRRLQRFLRDNDIEIDW